MLPRIVRRLLHRRGWEEVTYDGLLHSLVGASLSCQIAMAVMNHATRVTFGLPPGVELSQEDRGEILSRHASIRERCDAAMKEVPEASINLPKPPSEWYSPVCFRRRDGLPELPAWYEIDGHWCRVPGFPAAMVPYLSQHLCERPVSLGADSKGNGKAEWIEFTVSDDNHRGFARVGLVLEPDNSITIELLESRIENTGATVWWRHRKV